MREESGGRQVIYPGRSGQTLVMAFCGSAVAAVTGGIVYEMGSPRGLPRGPLVLYVVFSLVCAACCLGALQQILHYLRSRLVVNDEGVAYHDWRGRTFFVRWDGLVEVVVEDRPERFAPEGAQMGVVSSLRLLADTGPEELTWVEVGTTESRTKQVERAELLAGRAGLTYVGETGPYRVAWQRPGAADGPPPRGTAL